MSDAQHIIFIFPDPTEECKPYGDERITKEASKFPANWKLATIVEGDQTAQDLFAKINQTANEIVGNVPIKCE